MSIHSPLLSFGGRKRGSEIMFTKRRRKKRKRKKKASLSPSHINENKSNEQIFTSSYLYTIPRYHIQHSQAQMCLNRLYVQGINIAHAVYGVNTTQYRPACL